MWSAVVFLRTVYCRVLSRLSGLRAFGVLTAAVVVLGLSGPMSSPATAQVIGGVTVSVTQGSGSGTYDPGQMITVTAASGMAGQSFLRWEGDIGTLSNPFASTTMLTVPSSNVSLTAVFGVNAQTTTITFTSHQNGNIVDEKGFTVMGTAEDPAGILSITATVQIVGVGPIPDLTDVPLAVGPLTGQWALRLFDEDVPQGSDVTVTVEARNTGNETALQSLSLRAGTVPRDIYQLLSRTSLGVTPEMLAEATEMGYERYLDDQLKGARKVEKKVHTDEDFIRRAQPQKFFSKWRDNESEKIRQLMRERLSYLLFSENHLRETMALFWDNHFNTTATSNDDFYGELMEMRAFQENALGYFRDLLEISAKSTVMMNYLNNNTSAVGAINENYGRELLELHTVGVNAGYTDDDVISVARVFTGWNEDLTTKSQKQRDKKKKKKQRHDERLFLFYGEDHDGGFKTIPFLDTTIQGSGTFDPEEGEFPIREGMTEGEELLDILATHPLTATHICTKLVEYFVSDTPPATLVESCAADFLESGGHIATVVRAILMSSEFRTDPNNYRSKVKTPTDFMVSLIRNFGFEPNADKKDKKDDVLRRELDRITNGLAAAGQGWFRYPVPTGFKEDSTEWVSSTAMLERFQYVLRAPSAGERIVTEMGLETPEAIAATLMALSMGDRFSRVEYDAVVDELYGRDGRFDITNGERNAIRRGIHLIAMSPSYQFQ